MSGAVVLIIRLLVTLALYAFLAWALVTLWRDLQRQSRAMSVQPFPALVLLRLGESQAQPMRFTQKEVTIGRDLSNNVCLDEPTVSSRHARLAYRQAQWWVEDLHSTNGTFLNGEPVHSPMVLASGDELRCGQVLFTVSIQEDEKKK